MTINLYDLPTRCVGVAVKTTVAS